MMKCSRTWPLSLRNNLENGISIYPDSFGTKRDQGLHFVHFSCRGRWGAWHYLSAQLRPLVYCWNLAYIAKWKSRVIFNRYMNTGNAWLCWQGEGNITDSEPMGKLLTESMGSSG